MVFLGFLLEEPFVFWVSREAWDLASKSTDSSLTLSLFILPLLVSLESPLIFSMSKLFLRVCLFGWFVSSWYIFTACNFPPAIFSWSFWCFFLRLFKCLCWDRLFISVKVSCWKYLIRPTRLLILPDFRRVTTSVEVACREVSWSLIELFRLSNLELVPDLSFKFESLEFAPIYYNSLEPGGLLVLTSISVETSKELSWTLDLVYFCLSSCSLNFSAACLAFRSL